MTPNENISPQTNDAQPPAPRKSSQWKQIAIVFVSAIILSGSSCAAMASTWGTGHDNLAALALFGLIAGSLAIPVTIVWAIITLIRMLVTKRGAQQ